MHFINESSSDDPVLVNTTFLNVSLNASHTTASADSSKWSNIFDICQLAATVIGFFLNVLTLITLFINHKGFNRAILYLLRHQSFVDALVCLLASIVIVQPFKWLTGIYYLDVIVCYAWHGQAFYWGTVTLSTYNLVCISIERYLAVCKPFKHADLSSMSRKKTILYTILLYLLTLLITHGTYIQTKLTNDGCINEYAFDGPIMEHYFFGFVIFTYLTTYLFPVLIMIMMYSSVAMVLRKRGKDERLGHSRVIDRASSDLTKTAVVVTIIFILSIGYDLHYYLLGYTGVVVYELNTAIQKVGVFLSNLNSCANPIVYVCLMPNYRRSILMTFCCEKSLSKDSNSGSTHSEATDPSASQVSLSVISTPVEIKS